MASGGKAGHHSSRALLTRSLVVRDYIYFFTEGCTVLLSSLLLQFQLSPNSGNSPLSCPFRLGAGNAGLRGHSIPSWFLLSLTTPLWLGPFIKLSSTPLLPMSSFLCLDLTQTWSSLKGQADEAVATWDLIGKREMWIILCS